MALAEVCGGVCLSIASCLKHCNDYFHIRYCFQFPIVMVFFENRFRGSSSKCWSHRRCFQDALCFQNCKFWKHILESYGLAIAIHNFTWIVHIIQAYFTDHVSNPDMLSILDSSPSLLFAVGLT